MVTFYQFVYWSVSHVLLILAFCLFECPEPWIPLEWVYFSFCFQSFACQASDLQWLSIWMYPCFLIEIDLQEWTFFLNMIHFLNVTKYRKGPQGGITAILSGNEYKFRDTKWHNEESRYSPTHSVCVLGKSQNLSSLQFSHLYNRNTNICLADLQKGLNWVCVCVCTHVRTRACQGLRVTSYNKIKVWFMFSQ